MIHSSHHFMIIIYATPGSSPHARSLDPLDRSFISSRSFSTMATANDSNDRYSNRHMQKRRRPRPASRHSNVLTSIDQYVCTASALIPTRQSYLQFSSSSSSTRTHSSLASGSMVTRRHNTSTRSIIRSSRPFEFSFMLAAFALLVALENIQSICVHGHKPPPPRHPPTGTNIRSLITNGRRHISARSYTAASILVASSSNGCRKGRIPHAKIRGGHGDLNAGQKTKSSSSSVAYNQDALIDEEATWIMEEEYRGASKRRQRKEKGRVTVPREKIPSKGKDSDSSDDECWWESDPWDSDDGTLRKEGEEKDDTTKPVEEHPLRTDEWLVKIKVGGFPWSSAKENGMLFAESSYDDVFAENDDIKVPKRTNLGSRERVQRLKFSRSGLVWVVHGDTFDSGDASAKTAVGRWKLDHTGLHWDVEVAVPPLQFKAMRARSPQIKETEQKDNETAQITAATVDLNAADWDCFAAIAAGGSNDDKKEGSCVEGWRTTTLHYRTDIHLNKFGERPRMFKGIVTRDRYRVIGDMQGDGKKVWSLFGLSLPFRGTLFRPVVATFEACGIGEDTVDLAYRERGSASTPK